VFLAQLGPHRVVTDDLLDVSYGGIVFGDGENDLRTAWRSGSFGSGRFRFLFIPWLSFYETCHLFGVDITRIDRNDVISRVSLTVREGNIDVNLSVSLPKKTQKVLRQQDLDCVAAHTLYLS